MQIQGAIFDLDGTLGDTLPVCYEAYRTVFLKYAGETYSDEEIASMFGPSEVGIFQSMVPDQWEAALQAYLESYEKFHPHYGKKFHGIDRVLEILKLNNIPMAIVTGKGKRSADISLKLLELRDSFEIVEAGTGEGAVKPQAIRRVLQEWDLPGEGVFYVGDVTYDIRSAKEAGVIPLAAAWSKTMSMDELLSEEPKAIFSTINEFIDWLTTVGGLTQ